MSYARIVTQTILAKAALGGIGMVILEKRRRRGGTHPRWHHRGSFLCGWRSIPFGQVYETN